MTEQEKKWQAEDDARSLERYAELLGDSARMEAAEKLIEAKKKQLEAAGDMIKQALHGEQFEAGFDKG